MLPESLRIGVVQFKPEWGNVEKNLASTVQLIASAKKEGAEVVVLPEVWNPGMYGDLDYTRFWEPIPGRYTDFLTENAKRHRIHIIAGMPERGVGNKLHNASVMISDEGEILGTHRKFQPYTVQGEEKLWTPGPGYTVLDTKIGRVGLMICYDGDFPESWRAYALMGAEIVFHISFYESPCEGWWDKFYPAAALQNSLWSVVCNTVGDTVNRGKPIHAFGRSRIIAPDGEIEAEAPYVAPGEKSESYVLVKTVDARKRFEEARKQFGGFLIDRRVDLYNILTNRFQPQKR